MKYVDASSVLRVLFREEGDTVPLSDGGPVVSSHIVEVETYRAIDRARLLGLLDDTDTAIKRNELAELLRMIDLAPVDARVIDVARGSFAVNLRTLDAIHVATAELLASEAEGESLEFWSHDQRQATAALSRGLTVRGV
jgi:uncharacterized protein